MEDFDVFIHPSCYATDRDCEGGAPIILLNAQAVGIPVISTNHCNIPDEVIHQKTGLLSNEKDVQGLKKSILRFYKMENEEYQQFSKSALNHVQSDFDIKQNSKQLRKFYEELLA